MDNLIMVGKVTRLNILWVSCLQTSWQRYTPIEIESREFDLIKSFTRPHMAGNRTLQGFFFGGGYIWNQFRVFHPGYFAHIWRVCECKRPWMWSKPITLQLLTSVKQSLKFRFAVGFFGWFSCMFKVTGRVFFQLCYNFLSSCLHRTPLSPPENQ